MSSRAASAAASRRVKQELVRILYGTEATSSATTSKEACRSKKLDHSIYSYTDLKSAYLERLQALHPDKRYSEKHSDVSTYSARHGRFVELQEAWDRYEQMAKLAKNVDMDGTTDHKERNFTMFGVGCSFSDSEQERELRSEITDQACRGWFSSWSLSAFAAPSNGEGKGNADDDGKGGGGVNGTSPVRLLEEDDDMFIAIEKLDTTTEDTKSSRKRTAKPSLVDSRFRPRSAGG